MTSDYSSQILATVAAATINSDGTTPITYGCAITRTGTGLYNLILPTGEGLIDAQSFTWVTAKGPNAVVLVVSDNADTYTKVVTAFANTSGTITDSSLEIVVQRSTINPF
jgi:hypothetical protein